MSERGESGCVKFMVSVVCWTFAWVVGFVAVSAYLDLRARLDALESRAAWFMPEGQEHPQEVKRDE